MPLITESTAHQCGTHDVRMNAAVWQQFPPFDFGLGASARSRIITRYATNVDILWRCS